MAITTQLRTVLHQQLTKKPASFKMFSFRKVSLSPYLSSQLSDTITRRSCWDLLFLRKSTSVLKKNKSLNLRSYRVVSLKLFNCFNNFLSFFSLSLLALLLFSPAPALLAISSLASHLCKEGSNQITNVIVFCKLEGNRTHERYYYQVLKGQRNWCMECSASLKHAQQLK